MCIAGCLGYADKIATASHIAICLGVIVAIVQLTIFNLEHKHKKKQATVEFYYNVREAFAGSLRKINAMFPDGQIIKIHKIENDEAIIIAIQEYLSYLERFAVGINEKIYDLNVCSELIEVIIDDWHNRFENAILFLKLKYENPNKYQNLEKTIKKLKKLPLGKKHQRDLEIDKLKLKLEVIKKKEQEKQK